MTTTSTAPTTAPPLPTPLVHHRGRPAWRILASLLALAALAWGTINVVNLLSHEERRLTRTFAAEGIARIDVSTDRGSVRVVASERDDIRMSAYVSDGLGGTDQKVRRHGDRLLIDGSCNFPVAYWCTASYTLRVPRDVTLVLWSGSGDISVSGTTAEVDANTQGGSIDAARLRSATVRANSEHGSIRLRFATAPMRVQAATGHGDVTVVLPRTGEAYHVDLSSDDGSAAASVPTDRDARRTIELSSESGDLRVRHPLR